MSHCRHSRSFIHSFVLLVLVVFRSSVILTMMMRLLLALATQFYRYKWLLHRSVVCSVVVDLPGYDLTTSLVCFSCLISVSNNVTVHGSCWWSLNSFPPYHASLRLQMHSGIDLMVLIPTNTIKLILLFISTLYVSQTRTFLFSLIT